MPRAASFLPVGTSMVACADTHNWPPDRAICSAQAENLDLICSFGAMSHLHAVRHFWAYLRTDGVGEVGQHRRIESVGLG